MNQPLVIQGESNTTRTLSGEYPSIKIVNCQGLKVTGDFTVCGLSEREGKQDFLVTVIDSSVQFERLEIIGELEPEDKDYWMQWVPNGLHVTPGSTVEIADLQGKNLHTVAKFRGESCTIKSGNISHWSGDGVQGNADLCRIGDLHGTVPLAVFPYEQFHRDFIQFWQEAGHKTLSDCIVEDCTLLAGDGLNHPWEQGMQGIVGFDGTYKRLYIRSNKIKTDIEEHGISFGHLLNSDIFNNTVRSVSGKKRPFIQVTDRKTHKKSSGNRINNNDADVRLGATVDDNNEGHTPMNTKNHFVRQISQEQMQAAAADLSSPVWNLEAVLVVESDNQSGFLGDGRIKILYERHIAARQISKRGHDVSKVAMAYPAITSDLSFTPYKRGRYGSYADQWKKFDRLASLNIPDAEDIAIESCSWGAFQVLGNNWQDLGYESPKEFKRIMGSPVGQLDAFLRYVKVNNLQKALAEADWETFARGYNGKNYAKHGYHWKLARAYQRIIAREQPKKPGWRSRTTTAIGGTVVAGGTAGGITLDSASDLIAQVKELTAKAAEKSGEIKDIARNVESVTGSIDAMQWALWGVGGLSLAALGMAGLALYAYMNDRGMIGHE